MGANLHYPEYFNGLIDEVRIWRLERSADELKQSLNQSLFGSEVGLAGYWRFDEGVGSPVFDASGGNQTGALVSAGWSAANAPLQPFNGPPVAATAFASGVTSNSATLTGKADPLGAATTAWFEYGTNADYGNRSQAINLGNAYGMTSFSLLLSNLDAGQLYHWRAVASNSVAASRGLDRIFSTSGRTVGHSLGFDGSGSINVGRVDLGAWATNLTLEAWVRPIALTKNCDIIRAQGGWPEAPDWLISFQSTGTLFAVTLTTLPGGTVTVSVPIDPEDYANGDWHHIALTYDGAWKRVYKDGVEIAAWGQGYYVASNEGSSLLGSSFQGLMDEVRVWNVTRTAAQINQHMYSGLAGNEAGLVAYWRFDEGNGGTVGDSALHGYTGMLTGPTWSVESAPIIPFTGSPAAFTGSVTNVTTNSATIFGRFGCSRLPTTVYFEYGLTTNYGYQTMPVTVDGGSNPLSVTNVISDLQPAAYYHYRLTAVNSAGTNYGTDQVFLTVNIPGQPVVLWTYDVPAAYYSAMPSPAISLDGTIYLSTIAGLYAITNTGQSASTKWIFGSSLSGPPAIGPDGTIYFAGRNFYAVNPDGSQKWAYPFSSIASSVPAIALDGTVYIVGDGQLYAFTPGGAIKWTYNIWSYHSDGSSVIGPDGTIYVANDQYPSTLFALDPNGTLRWTRDGLSTGVNAFVSDGVSPAIDNNGIIYTAGTTLNALRPDGTPLWSNATNDFTGASPILGLDGMVYCSSLSRSLFAIDENGITAWQSAPAYWCIYQAGCVVGTTPTIDASGRIYYCVANGLSAFTPKRQLDWTLTYPVGPPTAWDYATTAPVIVPDGTIYAVFGSTLYAFAGTNALADSPWPMYRQNPRHTGSVERPTLRQINWRNDGGFEFRFYGQAGWTYSIQTSTNLSHWLPLANVTVGTRPIWVLDPAANAASARFYRAVSN